LPPDSPSVEAGARETGGSTTAPARWIAGLSPPIGASLLSVIVLISAMGGAQGAPHPPSVPGSPSLRTLTSSLYQATDQSGCGRFSVLTAAHYDNVTGAASFAATARAPNCTSLFGRAAGAAYQLTLSTPLNASAGFVRVETNWSLNVSISTAFHAGTCVPATGHRTPSCTQSVYALVSTFLWIQDETNGSTIVAPGSNWSIALWHYQHSRCFGGPTCPPYRPGGLGNLSFRGIVSLWANASLDVTHHYDLEIYLIAEAGAGLTTYPTKPMPTLSGGHGMASVRLGAPGNWTTLDSVWIR
jgi:hypothetical protein